jgi:hypothetical protein
MTADDVLIVVAPTCYSSASDIRYRCAQEACRQAAYHRVHLLLVDASPDCSFGDKLVECGKAEGTDYVQVHKQTSVGKKGAALREGIQQCLQLHSSSRYIGFMELEKVDMIGHWKTLVASMDDEKGDIAVPKRSDALFQSTYPIEQYHEVYVCDDYVE